MRDYADIIAAQGGDKDHPFMQGSRVYWEASQLEEYGKLWRAEIVQMIEDWQKKTWRISWAWEEEAKRIHQAWEVEVQGKKSGGDKPEDENNENENFPWWRNLIYRFRIILSKFVGGFCIMVDFVEVCHDFCQNVKVRHDFCKVWHGLPRLFDFSKVHHDVSKVCRHDCFRFTFFFLSSVLVSEFFYFLTRYPWEIFFCPPPYYGFSVYQGLMFCVSTSHLVWFGFHLVFTQVNQFPAYFLQMNMVVYIYMVVYIFFFLFFYGRYIFFFYLAIGCLGYLCWLVRVNQDIRQYNFETIGKAKPTFLSTEYERTFQDSFRVWGEKKAAALRDYVAYISCFEWDRIYQYFVVSYICVLLYIGIFDFEFLYKNLSLTSCPTP